jgi:phosphatidylglycerophosphate synthase
MAPASSASAAADGSKAASDNDGNNEESMIHATHSGDMLWKFFYIDGDSVTALQIFQYKGADNSLIYKYILSPLAQWCVDAYVPSSMAPNTITLIGLMLMLSSYMVVAYFCPQFDSHMEADNSQHAWVFIYSGICMLVYQTLDNMDGKQARKTGSSSPLGLLFDHGCDALNCVIGITNWCCAMGLDVANPQDVRIIMLVTISAYTPFYMATWEEYHTGALILPIVNGVTEGLILGASLMISAGVYGPQLWHDGTQLYDYSFKHVLEPSDSFFAQQAQRFVMHDPTQPKWRNCECLMILTYVLLAQEVLMKTWTVMSKPAHYGGGVFKPFQRLMPFVVCVICFLVIGQHGATSPESDGLTMWQRQPRISLLLSSTLFVELATQLMLSHMTLSEFGVTFWGGRLVMLPLVAYAILLCGGIFLHPLTEDLCVATYTSGMAAYLSMKITYVIHEICYAMQIWCFDIVTPRESNKHGKAKKKTS